MHCVSSLLCAGGGDDGRCAELESSIALSIRAKAWSCCSECTSRRVHSILIRPQWGATGHCECRSCRTSSGRDLFASLIQACPKLERLGSPCSANLHVCEAEPNCVGHTSQSTCGETTPGPGIISLAWQGLLALACACRLQCSFIQQFKQCWQPVQACGHLLPASQHNVWQLL